MNLSEILGRGLSESSFLEYVFHPRTAEKPKGVRKRNVTGRGGGRRASRVRAYNRMDPFKQRVIDAAGREKYLRGETTLSEARRELRGAAVERGIAKPLRPRVAPPGTVERAVENILRRAAERSPVRSDGQAPAPIKRARVVYNVRELMTPAQQIASTRLTYAELKAKASSRRYERIDMSTGAIENPFWYH